MLTTFPNAIPRYRVYSRRLQHKTSRGGFLVLSARRHVDTYSEMFKALCRRIGMSSRIGQIQFILKSCKRYVGTYRAHAIHIEIL